MTNSNGYSLDDIEAEKAQAERAWEDLKPILESSAFKDALAETIEQAERIGLIRKRSLTTEPAPARDSTGNSEHSPEPQ